MRIAKRCGTHRCVLVLLSVLGLMSLTLLTLPLFDSNPPKPVVWHVSPNHKILVNTHVEAVLERKCRTGHTRKSLKSRLPRENHLTQPFLSRDTPLNPELFLFPPPFGFYGVRTKLENVLKLLPSPDVTHEECRHCVVVGNGGILRSLELGPLIDRFDMVFRLNSGPLGAFSCDVGNRTSVRMSYPEGSPLHWQDWDPEVQFVAVAYKAVDLSWISAMISRHTVSLWDWLFFWQKVPDQIPIDTSRFRMLNLEVIRETAMDLLRYPPPKPRLWGWDQNVPTLGASALTLASLLCDEVSLAGFGYNLSQSGAPLHYYDSLPMEAMMDQNMHNVDRERELLQDLVQEGAISDLTGGLHCSFCPL